MRIKSECRQTDKEMRIIKINPAHPEDHKIKEGIRILKNGGLVAFPTDTVYGLGADAESLEAIDRLYQVKKRPREKPLILFLAEKEIAKRADYYQDRYGVVPSFKAGVHMGSVVVTEVGRAKSEIVFHGDAVNATARVTGLCSTLERDFLISDLIAGRLPECDFVLEPLGKHELKGKSETLGIIAVSAPVE